MTSRFVRHALTSFCLTCWKGGAVVVSLVERGCAVLVSLVRREGVILVSLVRREGATLV